MRRWLLLALGAHALLIGAARWAFREPAPAEPTTLGGHELAVEVEFREWREAPAPLDEAPSTELPQAARAVRDAAPLDAPPSETPLETAPLDAGPPRDGEGERSAALVEAEPEGGEEPSSSGVGEVDLGIGPDAWQRWAALGRERAPGATAARERRAGAYETPGAPKPSKSGGVQEGLEARDRELGLGPRGRVISAFHRAARTYEAPQLGTASFHVTVLKTGEVEISVGANSGETDKWRAVAARAVADLKKSLPRIPASRAGVRMVIDLVAEETYPNGLNPKALYGPRLEVQGPELKSTDETRKQLDADNPLVGKDPNSPIQQPPIQLELPGVYLSQRGKVCGYRLGLTPLGLALNGGCDPTNAGVKPQRIVRAKVRDEAMF